MTGGARLKTLGEIAIFASCGPADDDRRRRTTRQKSSSGQKQQ